MNFLTVELFGEEIIDRDSGKPLREILTDRVFGQREYVIPNKDAAGTGGGVFNYQVKE